MRFEKGADRLYEKLEVAKEWDTENILFYYKKRKVYPILNKDGTINWFNLLTGGSWLRLLGVVVIVIIIIGAIFEVKHFIDVANSCSTNFIPKLNITLP